MKKGVYVGTFNEKELIDGIDRQAVSKKMEETGLEYVNTEFIKKKGKIVGMNIWVCSFEDCEF